jgi:cytochrome b561
MRPPRRFLPRWLPGFRAGVEVLLYALLIIQPISGWLLASHAGTLASFVGWTLPPLADRNTILADIGFLYHGAGGVLIMIIALLSLRINLTAWVLSVLEHSKRGRRTKIRDRSPKSPDMP